MLIDAAFFFLMLLAVFKGYNKGFIVAVFSLLAFTAGLAAALKLSAWLAVYLGKELNSNSRWWPFIAFIGIFLVVAWLVNKVAQLFQKTLEAAMMGWVNRLAGIALFALLYSFIFSIFLFFLSKTGLIGPQNSADSKMYPYLQPLAPWVIDNLAKVIPVFKNVFEQLGNFFEKIPGRFE